MFEFALILAGYALGALANEFARDMDLVSKARAFWSARKARTYERARRRLRAAARWYLFEARHEFARDDDSADLIDTALCGITSRVH